MDAAPPNGLQFLPVTPDRWDDFKTLFESRGAPHYCWCMAWRKPDPPEPRQTPKQRRRASIRRVIAGGSPAGILAYLEGRPVAWCSVAPRDAYRALGGEPTGRNVWSIVCFFVLRRHRGRGIGRALLRQAVEYARSSGAQRVEAYPVETGTASYRFMGRKPAFQDAGFKHVRKAGKHRNVMILDL